MDYKKLATTVLVTTVSIGSMLILKNKGNGISKNTVEVVKNNTDIISKGAQTFAGLTLDELNNLARQIPRGLKVIIEGDTLKYFYSSASGKTKNIAEFTLNAAGEIVVTTFSKMTANSPRQFGQAFTEYKKSKNNL